MAARVSVDSYLRTPETNNPMELVYGVVREPPAPFYGHQSVVTNLATLLNEHARTHNLGRVCVL